MLCAVSLSYVILSRVNGLPCPDFCAELGSPGGFPLLGLDSHHSLSLSLFSSASSSHTVFAASFLALERWTPCLPLPSHVLSLYVFWPVSSQPCQFFSPHSSQSLSPQDRSAISE